MGFHDHSRQAPTAHRLLVEANGTPFAPCELTKPVVDVIAGRKTHDDLNPVDWIHALEESDGAVAIHLYLEGDHEWWLAYDANPREGVYADDFDGPYHWWTTYPTGAWEVTERARGILHHHLEELYAPSDPDEDSIIYRSRVVPIGDAPERVQDAVGEIRNGSEVHVYGESDE